MVEMHDDFVVPSPRLNKIEERSWKWTLDAFDSVDLYLTATSRKGPKTSRKGMHVVSGLCLDQSWLDKIYISNRGIWFKFMETIEHNNCQVLSDHIPITSLFVLKEATNRGSRKCSYLKMDHNFLDNKTFRESMKEIWV